MGVTCMLMSYQHGTVATDYARSREYVTRGKKGPPPNLAISYYGSVGSVTTVTPNQCKLLQCIVCVMIVQF